MLKPKIIKFLSRTLMMFAMLSEFAQSETLLQDAINSAKARKAAEINSANAPLPTPNSNPVIANFPTEFNNPLPPKKPGVPKVVNITGINDELVAEILYDNEVQKISLKPEFDNGRFMVVFFDDQKITLSDKETKKQITIRLPTKGDTGFDFFNALGVSRDALTGNVNSVPVKRGASENMPLPPAAMPRTMSR